MQPEQAIHPRELSVRRPRGIAIVADERPDDGPVLLLDVRAVVLAIGATTGEGNPFPKAVVVQRPIDELRAVVAVQPPERDRQAAADLMQRGLDAPVGLSPDGAPPPPPPPHVGRRPGVLEKTA